MRSLQARLFLAIVLVAATTLVAIGAFSMRTTARQFEVLEHTRRPAPDAVPATLRKTVAQWYLQHHSWSGVQTVLELSARRVLLFSSGGRFIAASFPGVERATLVRDPDVTIRLSLNGSPGLSESQELIVQGEAAQPIIDARGSVIAGLYGIPPPLPARPNPVRVLSTELWLAILCALLAALAAAMILSRNILAPVRALDRATAAIQDGDLSQRVNAGGPAELEQLAHRFNALAAHLERSESLRVRMIADIAHELRTPLTNIRAVLEALEDGHLPANDATWTSLSEEARFLERLVNDLQDLSLGDAGQLKFEIRDVSLYDNVCAVVAALNATARERNITTTIEAKAQHGTVEADEACLRQIIGNILSNAIRLAPENSVLRVVLEDAPGGIRVSVRDEGPGLSEEALQAVFERFYRADPSRSRHSGGAGLGLAIAKQLVEAQGGSICAANNSGNGATFSFTLPSST